MGEMDWQTTADWLGIAIYVTIRALYAIWAIGMVAASALTLFVLLVWWIGMIWHAFGAWLFG